MRHNYKKAIYGIMIAGVIGLIPGVYPVEPIDQSALPYHTIVNDVCSGAPDYRYTILPPTVFDATGTVNSTGGLFNL